MIDAEQTLGAPTLSIAPPHCVVRDFLPAETVAALLDFAQHHETEFEPTGEFVKVVSEKLAGSPPGTTLLVLPEGVMVNYLARLPSPVRPFYFFSATTSGGQEDEIVRALEARPPDFVAFISRDLREYGVTRYGERRGDGQQILEWVGAHYRLDSAIGDEDFLDSRQKGAAIMSRKR